MHLSSWIRFGASLAALLSSAAAFAASATPILIDGSLRAYSRTGENTPILGFVIAALPGTKADAKKRVLIQCLGPRLREEGVSDVMWNPMFTLYDGEGRFLLRKAAWGTDGDRSLSYDELKFIVDNGLLVGAPNLMLGSNDAAIVVDLPAGSYSLHMASAAGELGIGLIQIFDVSKRTDGLWIADMSARAESRGNGEGRAIAGFIYEGKGNAPSLVRVIGPTLVGMGVSSALKDPRLDAYGTDGKILGSSEDWSPGTNVIDVMAKAGAFPLPGGSKDAVLVLDDLPVNVERGVTVHGFNAGGDNGVVLIEVYPLAHP